MRKMIVNLGSNKYEDNNNSTCQLNHLQNLLLMSIVDTPEKDVLKFDRKLYKRKVLTSSVNSSPKLYSCSICTMYNRFHRDKKMSHAEVIYSWDLYINFTKETS